MKKKKKIQLSLKVKKKKKYDEKMISEIKEYYKNNSYKAKSIILQELRKNNNIKSLSNPVFNKIIENKY